MTPLTGILVVLVFSGVWLWIGASALPVPWAAGVGAIGVVGLLAAARHAWRNPAPLGGGRRFDRRKFAAAVAFEIVAANIVAWQLGRVRLLGYIWPSLGIVVALHFIGLWWASGDLRYIRLMIEMLLVNVVACFFAPGSAAMFAVCGLGSATALALALVRSR
jgi:hypothetical protein